MQVGSLSGGFAQRQPERKEGVEWVEGGEEDEGEEGEEKILEWILVNRIRGMKERS